MGIIYSRLDHQTYAQFVTQVEPREIQKASC